MPDEDYVANPIHAKTSAWPVQSVEESLINAPVLTIRKTRAKRSATILLAEDEPAVRDFVAQVLRDEGYHVLVAENGRKGLERCRNHAGSIHVLITDAVMPEMNGRELAEQGRRLRPNMKVLLMSGYVDRGLKTDDAVNPSYAFLEKPFTAESLLGLVESLCPAVNRATT